MRDINFLKDNGIDVDSAIELLGDEEMYEDILNDFLIESGKRMPLIENCKNSNDMNNYAIQVHAMKSDSKYLGFTKLAEMALEHQLKSEQGDVSYIREHYDELRTEADRIIGVVKNYFGG